MIIDVRCSPESGYPFIAVVAVSGHHAFSQYVRASRSHSSTLRSSRLFANAFQLTLRGLPCPVSGSLPTTLVGAWKYQNVRRTDPVVPVGNSLCDVTAKGLELHAILRNVAKVRGRLLV